MALGANHLRRTALLAVALATGLLSLASCGGTTDDPASASGGTKSQVVIEGIAFDPNEITIPTGETVMWLNEDEVDHTVTSGLPGKQGVPGVNEGTEPKRDGLFDEALPGAGDTFSFTFDKAGTYPYFCEIHASMRGVVTVE